MVGTNGWLPCLHCVSDSHCEKALDPYSIRFVPKGHKLRQRDGGHQRNAVSISRELSCNMSKAPGWIVPSALGGRDRCSYGVNHHLMIQDIPGSDQSAAAWSGRQHPLTLS